jgi:hypothetical protein
MGLWRYTLENEGRKVLRGRRERTGTGEAGEPSKFCACGMDMRYKSL